MWSRSYSAKHALRIGVQELCTVHVDTSWKMIQQRTRSTSHPCWISSLSRTFTSGRAGHTVTATGRKQVAKNTTRLINFKEGVERKSMKTFTIHGINVHNLIQQIENHPQREALQSDLQQHRAFRKSKDAIMDAGNTELCEIIDVEPKLQCKACFTHWSIGIVFCTCGHFMKDDSAENKKYISSLLDLYSIPNFYIRKGPATRSQVRESTWMQRVPYGKSTSKEMPQEEI